jgi:hypothetical protein
MRAMMAVAALLVVVALAGGAVLWYEVDHRAVIVALLPLVGAGFVLWWRLAWGAPLDWLDEHADKQRTVTVRELPGRLRALAAEARSLANVPARLSDELDELAGVAERGEPGTPEP